MGEADGRFGDRLREWRQRRKLSQQALGEKIGADGPRIHRLEKGTENPTLDTLDRLAVALVIDVGELLRPRSVEETGRVGGGPEGHPVLADIILALLDGLQPNPATWALFKATLVDASQDRRREAAGLRATLKKQIAALRAKEARLDEAFLFERTIDQGTYRAQRDRLRERLAIAQIELADASGRTVSIEDVLRYAHDVCARARVLWVDAKTVERRQQVQWALFPDGITVGRGSTARKGSADLEPQIEAASCLKIFELPDVSSSGGKNGAPFSRILEPQVLAWLAHVRRLRRLFEAA